MSTTVMPQPIEFAMEDEQTQQQPQAQEVTKTAPAPIHAADLGASAHNGHSGSYNYQECPCDSCQYYRQSSMYSNASASSYGGSAPSTPVTGPTTPNFGSFTAGNGSFGASASTTTTNSTTGAYQHNPYGFQQQAQQPQQPQLDTMALAQLQQSLMAGGNGNFAAQMALLQQLQQQQQACSTADAAAQMQQLMLQQHQQQAAQMAAQQQQLQQQQAQQGAYQNNFAQQQQMGMQQPQQQAPQQHGGAMASMDPEAINHPVAYSLTEQFRQIVGSIAATACTPRGRSLLQSVMRLQHADKVQTIFEELLADAAAVMLDSNGCHVVRSIIEMLDDAQVRRLVATMSEQTVLAVATTSQYTRRILQTLFERHSADLLTGIVDVLAGQALSLAATQQGCIALMRVIERCSMTQKEALLEALRPRLLELASDPFGNYVVQSVLEHCRNEVVVPLLSGSLLTLATNKFASNVMEKAFRFATPATRSLMLDELLETDELVQMLVQDGFGNFVIQAVIDSCNTQAEFRRLSDRIKPLIHGSQYSHKIETKLRNKKINNNGASSNAANSTPVIVNDENARPKSSQ